MIIIYLTVITLNCDQVIINLNLVAENIVCGNYILPIFLDNFPQGFQ